MKFVEIYAALSTTNAEIERGFSCMKRIKTDFRNKLSIGRLQDLLMISLHEEDIKLERLDERENHWNLMELEGKFILNLKIFVSNFYRRK